MIKRTIDIEKQKIKISRLYHYIQHQKVSEPKEEVELKIKSRSKSRKQKIKFKINESPKAYILKKTPILFGSHGSLKQKINHHSEGKRKQIKNKKSLNKLPILQSMKNQIRINPEGKNEDLYIKKLGSQRYNSLLFAPHAQKVKQKINLSKKQLLEEKKIFIPIHKTDEDIKSRMNKVKISNQKIVQYSAWDIKVEPEDYTDF